ncbi:hypothetical protein H4R33_006542, partial [Dimargaris cristalligena]
MNRLLQVTQRDSGSIAASLSTHAALTEAYCWDHSSPNTGVSEVDLDAGNRGPGQTAPRTPFASSIDPSLAYLEEIKERGVRDNPTNNVMMVSALEGLTLYWLVTMMKSRRILELGGFSGYSTLWMAEALKRNLRGVPDHPVISCELDPHYVQSIRAKATEFNMDPYVKVIEGPAMDSLKTKIEPGTQFDFIFIDANKDDYINYYNYIIDSGMLSSDGLIAVDNTLFSAQTFRKYPPVQQALERLPGTLPE